MVGGRSVHWSCFFLLPLGICMLLLSVPIHVHCWAGDWDVGDSAVSMDRHRCIPVVPKRQPLHNGRNHHMPLLRVYVTYSPQIIGMVLNLVESMMTSFPSMDDPTSDAEGAALERQPSFAQCQAWLRNGSLEHSHYQFRRRSPAAGRPSIVEEAPPSIAPSEFPFGGLCFGIHELSATATRSGGGTGGTPSSGGQGGDAEQTAAFGSASYYDFLEKKLKYFAHQLVDGTDVGQQRKSLYSRWALFLDADVQVFPGFFTIVAAKALCPYFALQCAHTNYLGACTPHYPLTAHDREHSMPPRVHVYFQRETRKLINTGVVLVDTAASGTRCLYNEASRLVQHSKFGDQTAIQRALKKLRGFCAATSDNAAPPAAAAGGLPSATIHPLVHSVFHRMHVNGNVLNRSLLVAHHAHMSGSGKQSALRRAVATMQQQQEAGNAPNSNDGAVVHSGVFLGSADAAKRRAPIDRWRSVCANSLPTKAATAACVLLKVSSSLASSAASNGERGVVAAVSPTRRQLLQLGHGGASEDASSSRGSAPSSAAGEKQQSADVAVESGESSSTGGGPSTSSSSGASVDSVDSSRNATALAKANRKLKKSKALWTALPALVVIITLTIFHCYIANPTPSYEGGDTADDAASPRRSTLSDGASNDVEMETRVDVSGVTERSRMVV